MFLTQEQAALAAAWGGGVGLLRPGVCCQPQIPLCISTLCVKCVSPSSVPSDACPFLPPSAHTHAHTHTHTLWISTECMKYMSPSSGPSDACPFLLSSPPSARTHTHTLTHTHPPGVVLRQKIDWHLSCIDLPVADTLSEPVMTKQ